MGNENRGFKVLAVVLVLVAAIVAGNFAIKPTTASPITPTGYYTPGQGCTWQETPVGSGSNNGRSLCPASRPNIVAGGCEAAYAANIQRSFPQMTLNFTTQGWECSFSSGGYGAKVYANCCG